MLSNYRREARFTSRNCVYSMVIFLEKKLLARHPPSPPKKTINTSLTFMILVLANNQSISFYERNVDFETIIKVLSFVYEKKIRKMFYFPLFRYLSYFYVGRQEFYGFSTMNFLELLFISNRLNLL